MTAEMVEVDGKPREYEVYFTISKLSKRTLRICVVSAYARDPNYSGSKKKHLVDRHFLSGKSLIARTLRDETI